MIRSKSQRYGSCNPPANAGGSPAIGRTWDVSPTVALLKRLHYRGEENTRMEQEALPVFVYGTLKRGEERARCWPRSPERVVPATTQGRLYDLGTYPALVQ